MAEKTKMPDRDKTLINILERMADQLQRQGIILDDIIKNQNESAKAMGGAEYHRGALQRDTADSLGKIQDSVSRYRSDMLNLVHEQDSINKSLQDLNKLVNKSAYSLENSNQKLIDLDERSITQGKITSEHYAHALKQAEQLPKEIADTERSLTRLHAATEKRLGEQHSDTLRQLEKLQHETTRRLLVLENVDSALKTLLIRTEPPEKKPLLIIRPFKAIGVFFRVKLPRLFKGSRARSE